MKDQFNKITQDTQGKQRQINYATGRMRDTHQDIMNLKDYK